MAKNDWVRCAFAICWLFLFKSCKTEKWKMKHNNGGQYKEMRILNSILRSNALLRSALERSWGFLRGSSIRASLQQQRNKRAILVKVILANLKAHKFLTKFSIKNWLDLSRRQFHFYFQKVCFLVSCDSKISVGIKDSFPLIPNLFKSLYNITILK